jgi:hypothetical protein
MKMKKKKRKKNDKRGVIRDNTLEVGDRKFYSLEITTLCPLVLLVNMG